MEYCRSYWWQKFHKLLLITFAVFCIPNRFVSSPYSWLLCRKKEENWLPYLIIISNAWTKIREQHVHASVLHLRVNFKRLRLALKSDWLPIDTQTFVTCVLLPCVLLDFPAKMILMRGNSVCPTKRWLFFSEIAILISLKPPISSHFSANSVFLLTTPRHWKKSLKDFSVTSFLLFCMKFLISQGIKKQFMLFYLWYFTSRFALWKFGYDFLSKSSITGLVFELTWPLCNCNFNIISHSSKNP